MREGECKKVSLAHFSIKGEADLIRAQRALGKVPDFLVFTNCRRTESIFCLCDGAKDWRCLNWLDPLWAFVSEDTRVMWAYINFQTSYKSFTNITCKIYQSQLTIHIVTFYRHFTKCATAWISHKYTGVSNILIISHLSFQCSNLWES